MTKPGRLPQDLLRREDGFPDDPLPELREQRVRLQYRNELIRGNHAVDVVFPAKQRLRADQRLRLRVHHRLIEQIEALVAVHDGGADRVQLLQSLLVLLVQIVPELHQTPLLAELGFLVGKVQAGVDRLGIDVEAVHPQRAAVQLQQ